MTGNISRFTPENIEANGRYVLIVIPIKVITKFLNVSTAMNTIRLIWTKNIRVRADISTSQRHVIIVIQMEKVKNE
ncbi:MAG: hypothetical protein A2499_06915 [Stygiobacter sp. RIFOXYC12_FULL_38_8]|nr:MAG: hypothetical protein A2237_03695 [Stygiobacter sp. RIFOXYA2_FULL_38_8]OGV29174.1 MAG: hypothetical protein A2499_06915 [Stygiobacter sp. RIFOXYC12_FULL_38_8]